VNIIVWVLDILSGCIWVVVSRTIRISSKMSVSTTKYTLLYPILGLTMIWRSSTIAIIISKMYWHFQKIGSMLRCLGRSTTSKLSNLVLILSSTKYTPNISECWLVLLIWIYWLSVDVVLIVVEWFLKTILFVVLICRSITK